MRQPVSKKEKPKLAPKPTLTQILVKADHSKDSRLTTLKTHLREKYLNDIDVIQRSTAQDPEAWTKLEEITAQIEAIKKLLRDTEDLILPPSDQETNQNQPGSNQGQIFKEKQDVAAEICCPICFEEMVAPKKILCCTNGHPICSDCDDKVKSCPVCRETFGKAPRRNPFAERLISVFLQATTSKHD